MNNTFGFIGTGNMGSALADAICRAVGAGYVYVSDAQKEKAEKFASEHLCHAAENEYIAGNCDAVVFAVKPQGLKALLASLSTVIKNRRNPVCCVSIAVGISTENLAAWLGDDSLPIFRVMPNTPALVGEGMLLYSCNSCVTEEIEDEFCKIFCNSGKLSRLPEGQMDAAGALSGCGPAYVALVAEGLADGAVQCGVPRDKAMLYAWQTLLGTASLALETGMHPGELKDMVCSPAGTTIEAVKVLEEKGFRGAVMDAMEACIERNKQL